MAALRRHVVADFLQNAIAMPRRYGKRDKGDGGVTADSDGEGKYNGCVWLRRGIERFSTLLSSTAQLSHLMRATFFLQPLNSLFSCERPSLFSFASMRRRHTPSTCAVARLCCLAVAPILLRFFFCVCRSSLFLLPCMLLAMGHGSGSWMWCYGLWQRNIIY